MSKSLKGKMYDLIRPFHSPITRVLRRRLCHNFAGHPEMELPPPYEFTQLDVERNLHRYLRLAPENVAEIAIVGAADAEEVVRMHRLYPRAKFRCFEPNPNSYQALVKNYGNHSYVSLSQLALSDTVGKTRFYELDQPGNGSILEPDLESWSTFNRWPKKSVESFEVNLSTLDREFAGVGSLDLLWMDVQGGEGRVLAGGTETLGRTKAVLVEVALAHFPYKGATLFPDLAKILQARGFTCVGLGIDAWNGCGNAFFVKDFEKLACK